MKWIYIFLIIILPVSAIAQSNYHEGLILKNNGDTIRGYINYKEWNENPRSIDFKAGKEDKQVQHFDPVSIKGFEITGMETYMGYIGPVSMGKTSFSYLPRHLDTTVKQDTIFIKQVVTGRYLTLFYHNDEVKTRFFIAERGAAPVELKYYEYVNEDERDVSRDIYKGQLTLYITKYTQDGDKLNNSIEKMYYTESDLQKIVDKINNNGNIIKRKTPIRFFAGLGINNTTTEVDNVDASGIRQDYTTLAPVINAGIDIFDNPNVQRFVFRAEVSFSYVSPRFTSPVTVAGVNTNNVYEFNQYTGSITPQVIFNVYNKDNLKLFLGLGVAFNFSVYSNDKYTTVSPSLVVTNAYTIEHLYHLEPFYSNFPLEAGITINKKTELSLTYVGFAAFTQYENFSASNRTVSLRVKYLFGK